MKRFFGIVLILTVMFLFSSCGIGLRPLDGKPIETQKESVNLDTLTYHDYLHMTAEEWDEVRDTFPSEEAYLTWFEDFKLKAIVNNETENKDEETTETSGPDAASSEQAEEQNDKETTGEEKQEETLPDDKKTEEKPEIKPDDNLEHKSDDGKQNEVHEQPKQPKQENKNPSDNNKDKDTTGGKNEDSSGALTPGQAWVKSDDEPQNAPETHEVTGEEPDPEEPSGKTDDEKDPDTAEDGEKPAAIDLDAITYSQYLSMAPEELAAVLEQIGDESAFDAWVYGLMAKGE